MENARRARRHLQRARDLLGFGYIDSSHETRYKMKFGGGYGDPKSKRQRNTGSDETSNENEPKLFPYADLTPELKREIIKHLDGKSLKNLRQSAKNKDVQDYIEKMPKTPAR